MLILPRKIRGTLAMDITKIAERSYDRVAQRVPDDSPLKSDDGCLLCPWCRRPMRVRFSTLGHIHETDDGRTVHVNGVQMKCADGGCCFRPDFDIPIDEAEYQEEIDLRNGKKMVKMGQSAETPTKVEERLKDLGYKM